MSCNTFQQHQINTQRTSGEKQFRTNDELSLDLQGTGAQIREVLHPPNYKYCLEVGPKIIAEIKKLVKQLSIVIFF